LWVQHSNDFEDSPTQKVYEVIVVWSGINTY
jgi:hypothetical protein